MKLPLQLRELELGDDRFEEGNGGGAGGGEEGGFSGVALLGESGGFSLRGFAMSDGCGCVCLVSGAGGRKVNESSERAVAAAKRLLGGGALSLTHDAPIRGAARRLNSGAGPEVEEFAIARRSGATRSSFPLSRRKNHAFHDPSRVIAGVADRTHRRTFVSMLNTRFPFPLSLAAESRTAELRRNSTDGEEIPNARRIATRSKSNPAKTVSENATSPPGA